MVLINSIVAADPSVRAELAKLKLPESVVTVCEPWIYGIIVSGGTSKTSLLTPPIGSDGVNDERRQFQCFMFVRDPRNPNEPDSNHYAFPLSFSPVVDVGEKRVSRIDRLPLGVDNMTNDTTEYKFPPPNEYIPEAQIPRTDLKPYNVTQPQGASFTVAEDSESGRIVWWQKWHFRLGFNIREGMILYDVSSF